MMVNKNFIILKCIIYHLNKLVSIDAWTLPRMSWQPAAVPVVRSLQAGAAASPDGRGHAAKHHIHLSGATARSSPHEPFAWLFLTGITCVTFSPISNNTCYVIQCVPQGAHASSFKAKMKRKLWKVKIFV